MKPRGFTLIELVVTVAIVGLLATAAMPLVQLTAKRGKEQDLRTALREIRTAIDAYKLAAEPFPGHFGIFYKTTRPTKNANEAKINAGMQEKVKGLKDWEILKKNFDRMK